MRTRPDLNSRIFAILAIGTLACVCGGREQSPETVELIPEALTAREQETMASECGTGDSYQCYRLAGTLSRETQDPVAGARALELSGTACDRGFLLACFQSARFYEEGVGVFPDPREAYRRHEDVCNRLHLSGCIHQARLLEEGVGVARDIAAANALLERTCHHQTLNNCLDIAREIHSREGRISAVASEYNLCTLGWNLSCHHLGEIKAKAFPTEASRWRPYFENACNRGYELSCGRLETGQAGPDAQR